MEGKGWKKEERKARGITWEMALTYEKGRKKKGGRSREELIKWERKGLEKKGRACEVGRKGLEGKNRRGSTWEKGAGMLREGNFWGKEEWKERKIVLGKASGYWRGIVGRGKRKETETYRGPGESGVGVRLLGMALFTPWELAETVSLGIRGE